MFSPLVEQGYEVLAFNAPAHGNSEGQDRSCDVICGDDPGSDGTLRPCAVIHRPFFLVACRYA